MPVDVKENAERLENLSVGAFGPSSSIRMCLADIYSRMGNVQLGKLTIGPGFV
jgi:hypothetical protein